MSLAYGVFDPFMRTWALTYRASPRTFALELSRTQGSSTGVELTQSPQRNEGMGRWFDS
jgi:hypothetical protein